MISVDKFTAWLMEENIVLLRSAMVSFKKFTPGLIKESIVLNNTVTQFTSQCILKFSMTCNLPLVPQLTITPLNQGDSVIQSVFTKVFRDTQSYCLSPRLTRTHQNQVTEMGVLHCVHAP